MWDIETTDTFDAWYEELDDTQRSDVLAGMLLLQEKGPQLSRPYADTLNGAKFLNMKELRIQSKGQPLRAFYAFDPKRVGVVLCAGNKVGNEKQFYKNMIPVAEKEYQLHLDKLR